MSKENKKTIRIYGITLPEPEFRTLPYGHGKESFKGQVECKYVDIPIEEIIGSARFCNKFNELYNSCRTTNLEINFDPKKQPNKTKKLI